MRTPRLTLTCALLALVPLSAAGQIGHSSSGLTSANPEAAGNFPQELQNQGLMTYSVPIEVNEARGRKVTPKIALAYTSTTRQGPLGAGWTLPLTYVELDVMRRTPDAPDAIDPATGLFVRQRFVFAEAGARHALVETSPGEFRAAVESRFLLFTRVAERWEAIDGANTRFVFRLRQTDPEDRTWRWYLTEVIDGNGNWARYVYRQPLDAAFPGAPAVPLALPDFGQTAASRVGVVLWGVVWNATVDPVLGAADANVAKDQLQLLYEDRPDRQLVGELGAVTQTTVRLKEVRVLSRDGAGVLRRVRTYHLGYWQSPTSLNSLLRSIQLTGAYCESAPNACPANAVLPPTTFSYSTGLSAVGTSTQTIRAAAGNLPDHMGFQVVERPRPQDEDDVLIGGASFTRAGAIDLNGDGRRDLMTVDYRQNPTTSVFEFDWHLWANRGGDEGRDASTPFDGRSVWEASINERPAKDFSDLIDLNGDGRPDLVRSGWRVHFNNGSSFDDAAVQWEVPTPRIPAIDCPAPFSRNDHVITRNREEGLSHTVRKCTVRDLTGDGIPDYVETDTGDVNLWRVYPGFLRGGAPDWPPRGGFSRDPIPWRIARQTSPGANLFTHVTRSWAHGAEQAPRDANRRAGDSYTESMLADVNGDGLPDLLPRPFQVIGTFPWRAVMINTGRGFREVPFDIPQEVFDGYPNRIIYLSKTESSSVSSPVHQTQGLLDVNGDGLPDLLRYKPGPGDEAVLVAFGTGSGFTRQREWLSGTLAFRGFSLARWDRAGVRLLQRRGFFDVDGDGLLDYVKEATASSWSVLVGPAGLPAAGLRQTAAPDRLIEVDNGIGGSLEVSYRPSTSFRQVRLPFVLQLVSSLAPAVRAQSGSGGPPVTPLRAAYEEGRMWRHPESGISEFRGFARVVQSREGGGSTTTAYAVADAALSGRPQQRELRDARGCLYRRYTNQWVIHNAAGGTRVPFLGRQEETHFHVPSTCAAAATRSHGREILAADDFGHALREVDRGESAGTEDDLYTLTDHAVGPAGRPLDLPWRIRHCRDAACATPLSEVRYAYDGDLGRERSALPLGRAGAGGNLRTITQVNYDLSDPTRAPQILELARHTYGTRGNLASSVAMHDGTEGTKTTVEYDTRFQLLPVATTTGLAAAGGSRPAIPFTTRRTYDVVLGLSTSEAEPNGHVTHSTIDPFGRVVRVEVTRGATREKVSEKEYLYDARGAEVTSRTFHAANRYDEERSRLDGLGRTLRTWTPLGADVGNRSLVKKEMSYDSLGRLLVAREPGQDGSSSRMARYYFYDAQDRIDVVVLTRTGGPGPARTERTNPATDTFVTRYRYGLVSSGWFIDTYDPNATGSVVSGAFSREVRDLRGRLVESADRAGNRTLFAFDLLGNLERVTRSLEPPEGCAPSCPPPVPVLLTFGHDSLGRTIEQDDPDKGRLRFSYDYAGRVVRQEEADLYRPNDFDRALSYDYDLLGRMIRKRALRKTGGNWAWDPSVDATFQYDQPAAGTPHPYPTNLLGRLASFSDATGTTFFGYDKLGNNTHLAKDFAGLPAGQRRYHVERTFSASGRLAAVDNGYERLEYGYNSAGWLRSAGDFYNVQSFDEIGLPTMVLRAQATISEQFAFDAATHRLQSHLAVGPQPATPLLSLSYGSYDPMGHLLTMRDRRSQTDYLYSYDAAYRLRTAGAFNLAGGSGTPFNLLYLYDSLGNLREERDAAAGGGRAFGYRDDGRQPHAAVQVQLRQQAPVTLDAPTRLIYGYGNLVETQHCIAQPRPTIPGSGPIIPSCRTGRTAQYTAEDRLVRLAENGFVSTLGWDAQGERSWQRLERPDGSKTTVYSLGRWIDVVVEETAAGQTTTVDRHLWAGNQRIATRRTVVGSPNVEERHYLSDHLGSVRVVTNEFGEVLARRDYLPFGRNAAALDPAAGRFGFTGQEEGLARGIYLLGPRAYDPLLLRFLSADSIIPDPTAGIAYNRYAYAYDNPLSLVDPSGHNPLLIIVGAFIASISLIDDLTDAINAGDAEAAALAVGFFAIRVAAIAFGSYAGDFLYGDIVSTVGGGMLNEAVATGVEWAVASAFRTLGEELTSGRKIEVGSLLKNVGVSAAVGFGIGAFVGAVRADVLGVDRTYNKEVQAQLSRMESFYRSKNVEVDFSGVTVRHGGVWTSISKANGYAFGDTVGLRGTIPLDASNYKFFSTMAHELAHVQQVSEDFLMPVRYGLHELFSGSINPYEVEAGLTEAAYVYCRAWSTCP